MLCLDGTEWVRRPGITSTQVEEASTTHWQYQELQEYRADDTLRLNSRAFACRWTRSPLASLS